MTRPKLLWQAKVVTTKGEMMADAPVVHIGENSAEHVAYKLFLLVVQTENKSLVHGQDNMADRAYILRAYLDCWSVTHGRMPTQTPSS